MPAELDPEELVEYLKENYGFSKDNVSSFSGR